MSRKVQPNSPHAARQASVHVKKRALNYKMSQPLLALTKWRPSVLPLTVKRAEMWFFTILHTILVVCVKTDITEQLFGFKTDVSGIDLPFNAIAVSSTLMGFMLIFFNNQTYSRYMGYYNACTGIGGVMQEISEQTSTHLCDLPSIRWDVNRYAMTSALLVYFKVTDPPGSTPVVDDEEWERLTSSEEAWQGIDARTKGGLANLDSRNGHWGSPALLTEAEKQVLKSKKGVLPSLMLQTWAMRAAREGYKKAGVEAPIYTQLQSSIMDLRRHCAYITNNLALPIPFPYYHALVALMMINFTLYCVAFLLLQSWISPVPMFLVTLITTGVREVSCALANPFGDDEVDFPVQKYIADLRALVSTMCNNFEWQPTLDEMLAIEKPGAKQEEPPPAECGRGQYEMAQQAYEQAQYEMAYDQMAYDQMAYDQQRYEQQQMYPPMRWGRHQGECLQKYETAVPPALMTNGGRRPLPPVGARRLPPNPNLNSYYVAEGKGA